MLIFTLRIQSTTKSKLSLYFQACMYMGLFTCAARTLMQQVICSSIRGVLIQIRKISLQISSAQPKYQNTEPQDLHSARESRKEESVQEICLITMTQVEKHLTILFPLTFSLL